jgi:hypothetical protein
MSFKSEIPGGKTGLIVPGTSVLRMNKWFSLPFVTRMFLLR